MKESVCRGLREAQQRTKMKKYFKFHLRPMLAMMLLGTMTLGLTASCGDDKEDDDKKYNEEQLYVRPWQEYPASYIKFCDYRFTFRLLNIQRNGSAVQIDYTLTNTAFGGEVSTTFYTPDVAAHDDLGNAYQCKSQMSDDVVAMINGEKYANYGNGQNVTFMPNQTIRGSFTIKNFDMNATQVSLTVNVDLTSPKNIALAYNRIDFVNIPIDGGSYSEL